MAEDSNELLIALVRSRPVLWDKSSDKYRHVGHTKAAWAEVCRKLEEEYDSMTLLEQEMFSKDVVKKWTNLRDAMVKSLKKNRKYIYADQLQFLARFYEADPQEEEEKEVDDESKSSQLPVEISSDQLIACMEKWPCLWDKSLATYKDRTHNKSAWLAVVQEMNPDFDQLEACDQETYRKEIIKKWNNMRDTYAKSLKKITGSGKCAKKYVHADQLHFLRRFYTAYDDPGDEEWRFQETTEEMPDPPDVVLHEHTEETVLVPSWDFQPNNFVQTPIQENSATQEHEDPTWEPTSFENPKKRRRQDHHEQQLQRQQQQPEQQQQQRQRNQSAQDEVDQRILSVLDRIEPENRHLSFFKGIVPSLENFDEDEVLQFQMQVLRVIRDMRKRRREKLPSKSHSSTRHPSVKSEIILSDDVSEQSSSSLE